MSLDDDRQYLADLLNDIPGVHGMPFRSPAPREGDAWPTLPTLDLDQGLVWRPTWTIVVVLPADERRAATWMDQHLLGILAALRAGTAFPTSAEPALMATSAGEMYVVEITLRSH